jgi:EAL domain-containing protein (putative c-di-GMP-specific phosphodiesterase class I)
LKTPIPPSNRLVDGPSAVELWQSPYGHEFVRPDQLSVVFQPIVELGRGKLFAYEALVRCQVPRFASPPDLFAYAVAIGGCGRLGRMIRDIAVPLCAGRPVFLNVHPQELNESWIVRPDDPIFLHDHDVYLEITESVPLTHFELCLDVLDDLRSRGCVHLVVDDLGAGYSNLKSIADLNPKVVKLDRGLIAGIDLNVRQRQLVSSVVRLCTDLSALVVAEGIETRGEFNALLDTGVHFGQGYLFARPSYPIPSFAWPPEHVDDLADTLPGSVAPPSH